MIHRKYKHDVHRFEPITSPSIMDGGAMEDGMISFNFPFMSEK